MEHCATGGCATKALIMLPHPVFRDAPLRGTRTSCFNRRAKGEMDVACEGGTGNRSW